MTLPLKQQPCRAIQFVYDLQERFCQNKDQHIADKIAAVISEGAGIGGIDTTRQATEEESKIAYGALYQAIDENADIPTLTFEDSLNPTLKEHQKVVHSIYLSRRDQSLKLGSPDFLKDETSYKKLVQSSQEHSEQYIKNMSSLERYLNKTKILEVSVGQEKEQLTQVLRKSLTKYIVENNNKWIDPQDLKVAEQFFWNLNDDYLSNEQLKKLIMLLFEVKVKRNWKDFKNYYEPYFEDQINRNKSSEKITLLELYQYFPNGLATQEFTDIYDLICQEGVNNEDFIPALKVSLKIYQDFPDKKDREAFFLLADKFSKDAKFNMYSWKVDFLKEILPIYKTLSQKNEFEKFLDFCKVYGPSLKLNFDIQSIICLFPVYQAFSKEDERKLFAEFCKPFLKIVYNFGEYPSHIKKLLLIYQAFPQSYDRQKFINFCQPYAELIPLELEVMSNLLTVYQGFPEESERKSFIKFCEECLKEVWFLDRARKMKEMVSVYKAFSNTTERQKFLDFCKPYIKDATINYPHHKNIFEILLQIYQDSERKESFPNFMKRFYFLHDSFEVINSYSTNSYLRYMRNHAALCPSTLEEDESIAISESLPVRNQIIERAYLETDLFSNLPVIDATDPNLLLIQNRTFTNAHDFDAVYELDRELLWKETAGYQGKDSAISLTIHNNQEKQENYHTNKEVEDFIQYLDEEVIKMDDKIGSSKLNPVKAINIVKQMLGLTKKEEGTTGEFAPYLGHSMYYSNPDSPKGDEMLGRVWFLMKKIAEEKKDKDLKKAVVVAILEAAEVSASQLDTHCQTRMTGELMKLVSWHLPESKLRPLIAAADLKETDSDEELRDRIIAAPERAQQLFKRMKMESSGNIKRLYEKHIENGTDAELWEVYEAYYDELYRRTRNENDKGYKLDENILKRDDRGNLVNFYQADGIKRETPRIVYYQAEFQVFEKAFTDLMRQEFEEQRGLKY